VKVRPGWQVSLGRRWTQSSPPTRNKTLCFSTLPPEKMFGAAATGEAIGTPVERFIPETLPPGTQSAHTQLRRVPKLAVDP